MRSLLLSTAIVLGLVVSVSSLTDAPPGTEMDAAGATGAQTGTPYGSSPARSSTQSMGATHSRPREYADQDGWFD
jgi:hypothetical protein